jgi:long-subunit fatty acid transport protein
MKSIRSISITRLVLGLFLTVVATTGLLRAQFAEDALRLSIFNTGIGARSSGMGNTSIGVANDYSSLFTNPAGLTSLRSFEFSAGLSNVGYNNDAAFFGNTLNNNARVTNLNNFGLVYPVPTSRGSLSFAFGFARVANYSTVASFDGFNPNYSIVEALTQSDNQGLNLNAMSASDREKFLGNDNLFQSYLVDIDTTSGKFLPNVTDSVQQKGTVSEGGGINSWSFGGAIEIAKGLSLGLGVNYLSGSYTYDRVYTESDSRRVYLLNLKRTDFNRFEYESTINSDINGYNVLIGLMYNKQGRYKLGLTVRTPTYYDISEDFSDIGTSLFYNLVDGQNQYYFRQTGSTKYTVKTPMILSAGASVQATDWLLVAGDAEYTDWTQMEFTNDNPDLIDENRVIRDVFRATTNLRGGAEISLLNYGVKLRAGVVYNPSPYKGDPTSYDQLYYTAGIGGALEDNVFLNASLAFGKWNSFRDNYYLSGLDTPASRTSESITTNSVNVTLSYRF